MHETRNFLLVIVLAASTLWAALAWFVLGDDTPALLTQRIVAPVIALLSGFWLVYALGFEDKLPDHLAHVVGPVYYEADGLSFMPMVRVSGGHPELCVYYQNRFENPVQAIVHLRPPDDSFIIRPGAHDVHFAFKADGGDFGAIHQPIAVPPHLQGEVIDVKLAGATFYPRSHGACLRRRAGALACGTLLVDWAGAAFKTGVHEVSSEIKLVNPATLHLSMPNSLRAQSQASLDTWKQEQLVAGGVA
jgi:hypothetical protein